MVLEKNNPYWRNQGNERLLINIFIQKKEGELWKVKTGINCFRKALFMFNNYLACKLHGANFQ